MIKQVFDLCLDTLKDVKNMTVTINAAVNKAYEEKAAENGHITAHSINEMLKEHTNSVTEFIREKISNLETTMGDMGFNKRRRLDNHPPPAEQNDQGVTFDEESRSDAATAAQYRLYCHGSRMWHVPQNLVMNNRLHLRSAFRMWIFGMPGHQITSTDGETRAAPVRPFHLLKSDMLPKDVRASFENHWAPVMKILANGIDITEVNEADFQDTYSSAFEVLKTQRLSYVFQKERAKPTEWAISTWAKHSKPSMIRKHGTEIDRSHLPTLRREGSRQI
jgi:hypothetical protein